MFVSLFPQRCCWCCCCFCLCSSVFPRALCARACMSSGWLALWLSVGFCLSLPVLFVSRYRAFIVVVRRKVDECFHVASRPKNNTAFIRIMDRFSRGRGNGAESWRKGPAPELSLFRTTLLRSRCSGACYREGKAVLRGTTHGFILFSEPSDWLADGCRSITFIALSTSLLLEIKHFVVEVKTFIEVNYFASSSFKYVFVTRAQTGG